MHPRGRSRVPVPRQPSPLARSEHAAQVTATLYDRTFVALQQQLYERPLMCYPTTPSSSAYGSSVPPLFGQLPTTGIGRTQCPPNVGDVGLVVVLAGFADSARKVDWVLDAWLYNKLFPTARVVTILPSTFASPNWQTIMSKTWAQLHGSVLFQVLQSYFHFPDIVEPPCLHHAWFVSSTDEIVTRFAELLASHEQGAVVLATIDGKKCLPPFFGGDFDLFYTTLMELVETNLRSDCGLAAIIDGKKANGWLRWKRPNSGCIVGDGSLCEPQGKLFTSTLAGFPSFWESPPPRPGFVPLLLLASCLHPFGPTAPAGVWDGVGVGDGIILNGNRADYIVQILQRYFEKTPQVKLDWVLPLLTSTLDTSAPPISPQRVRHLPNSTRVRQGSVPPMTRLRFQQPDITTMYMSSTPRERPTSHYAARRERSSSSTPQQHSQRRQQQQGLPPLPLPPGRPHELYCSHLAPRQQQPTPYTTQFEEAQVLHYNMPSKFAQEEEDLGQEYYHHEGSTSGQHQQQQQQLQQEEEDYYYHYHHDGSTSQERESQLEYPQPPAAEFVPIGATTTTAIPIPEFVAPGPQQPPMAAHHHHQESAFFVASQPQQLLLAPSQRMNTSGSSSTCSSSGHRSFTTTGTTTLVGNIAFPVELQHPPSPSQNELVKIQERTVCKFFGIKPSELPRDISNLVETPQVRSDEFKILQTALATVLPVEQYLTFIPRLAYSLLLRNGLQGSMDSVPALAASFPFDPSSILIRAAST